MKKRYWVAPLAAFAAVGVYAADLHTPHLGSSCPTGFVGRYHFVNNQLPEGTAGGNLYAGWDSGDTCSEPAYKVNLKNQHFRCTGMTGALIYAYTDLPGKLVLSDFTCRQVKQCDPKTEKCEG